MAILAGPKRQRILVDIAPTPPAAAAMFMVVPIGTTYGYSGNPAGQSYPVPSVLQKGQAFSVIVTTMNGVGPFTYSATGLPAGTSIASDGTWSGTPTTQGYGTATITSLDTGNGNLPTVQTISWNVAGLVALYGTLPQATAQNAYQASVLCVGATGTVTWSQSGLPAGLSISSTTGLITGTYATAGGGTFQVAITASDSGTGTSVTNTFTLVINRAPGATAVAFTTPAGAITATIPKCVAGAAFSTQCFQVNSVLGLALAGTSPVNWSATGLPAGLTINSLSGIISGTTSDTQAAGTYSVTITGIDYWGATSTRTVSFTVLNAIPQISPGQFAAADKSTGLVSSFDLYAQYFGNGIDGDIVLDGTATHPAYTKVGFNYTQNRPVYANSITFGANAHLDVNGNPTFVKTNTDMSAANVLIESSAVGINGTTSVWYGNSSPGGAGGIATTGGGVAGGSPTPSTQTGGIGSAGNGGNGGTGTGGPGLGGIAQSAAATVAQTSFPVLTPFQPFVYGWGSFVGGVAGGGGGAGAGNGTLAGANGGAGGGAGGIVMWFTYTLTTSASTTATGWSVAGGNGTNGVAAPGAGRGAGGGGGGGSGGLLWVVCAQRVGPQVANWGNAKGGDAGLAGTTGAGNAAVNGVAASSGFCFFYELFTNTTLTAGITARSGTTGGIATLTF